MAIIQHNVNLKSYNTFGIEATAKRFATVKTVDELRMILRCEKDVCILGGGSNILITSDIDQLVLHIGFRGISFTNVGENSVLVTCQAGENWSDFVLWCVSNNYGGLENLSMIPGNVGASPIQNIGAYGTEVKDTIHEIETMEIDTGKIIKFKNKECGFGYRDSIFKNKMKRKFVIISVTFELTRHAHSITVSHDDMRNELRNREIRTPSLKNISDIVSHIRNRKLPDPKHLGNCGSFFKNPVISYEHFGKLCNIYQNIPRYLQPKLFDEMSREQSASDLMETERECGGDTFKIPAAWLIEKCGFKGRRVGDAGVHKNHALVIVNYASATGQDICRLATTIQTAVWESFNILLEFEVNVVPN